MNTNIGSKYFAFAYWFAQPKLKLKLLLPISEFTNGTNDASNIDFGYWFAKPKLMSKSCEPCFCLLLLISKC